MSVVYSLDTGAVSQLIGGNVRMARLLYDASAHDHVAAVPVTCLMEAAAEIERAGGSREGLLTALRAPVLRVVPAPAGDRPILRAAAARVGAAGLAHAAIAAKRYRCRLLTTRAADVWPLGLADWQVVAL